MNRREWLGKSAKLGLLAAGPAFGGLAASDRAFAETVGSETPGDLKALKPPTTGSIPVAFLISDGAVLIDFAGPWEVFGNVMIGGRNDLFQRYTVAETVAAVQATGGMRIIPDYAFGNAPAPRVIVIPAQSEQNEKGLAWIREASKAADVTMSVCTGAYVLAQTGLLNGKAATTHHASYVDFATQYPEVRVKRGVRFVEDGNVASSGGLSCGIDLAFRVVERYFGQAVAEQTAYDMEYQGKGWRNAASNAEYLKVRSSTQGHPHCAVCGMDVDAVKGPRTSYKGKTYYFCSQDHKEQFDAAPTKFV